MKKKETTNIITKSIDKKIIKKIYVKNMVMTLEPVMERDGKARTCTGKREKKKKFV